MFKRVLLGAAVLLGQSACLSANNESTPSSVVPNTQTSEAPPLVRPMQPGDSTSLWTQYGDPSILAANAAALGSIEQSSRRHGCNKFKFSKLGDVLTDLGINMGVTTVTSPISGATPSLLPLESVFKANPNFDCAASLVPGNGGSTDAMDRATKLAQPARYVYCSGRLTLGMPPYVARLAEATIPTTAGVTKLFDVLAAAALEIAGTGTVAGTNLATATRCTSKAGVPALLFNPDNTCNPDGMACLQGYPPSADQVNLCNRMVVGATGTTSPSTVMLASGTTVPIPIIDKIVAGKQVATAAVLANGLLCE